MWNYIVKIVNTIKIFVVTLIKCITCFIFLVENKSSSMEGLAKIPLLPPRFSQQLSSIGSELQANSLGPSHPQQSNWNNKNNHCLEYWPFLLVTYIFLDKVSRTLIDLLPTELQNVIKLERENGMHFRATIVMVTQQRATQIIT